MIKLNYILTSSFSYEYYNKKSHLRGIKLRLQLLSCLEKPHIYIFLQIVALFKVIQDIEDIVEPKEVFVLLVSLESMRDQLLIVLLLEIRG